MKKNKLSYFKNIKNFDINDIYMIQSYLQKDKYFLESLELLINEIDFKLNDSVTLIEYNKMFIEFYNQVKLSYFDFKNSVINN